MPALRIQTVSGADILPYTEALARLRIAVFREWPYLYEGSMDYERQYLKKYAACASSFVALALDGETVVGASTAIPLAQADTDFKAAFATSTYAIDSIFYLGESVLLPEYRGQGLGHRFFEAREKQARALGSPYAAFCAVDREAGDPRKPQNYRQLDTFWQRRGYVTHPEIAAIFNWREIDQTLQSSHRLSFWIKAL